MFDLLNNSFHGYGFKKVFNNVNLDHLDSLLIAKEFVSSWKLSLSGSSMNKDLAPFKQCTLITLQSIYELSHFLFKEHSFKFFSTRRCNQDCIENCFSVIRGKGGQRDNPNTDHFESAIKNVIMCQVLGKIKPTSSNCEMDNIDMLDIIQLINQDNIPTTASNSVNENVNNDLVQCNMPFPFDNASTLSTIDCNVVFYIAGFVAKRIISHQKCIACKLIITGSFQDSLTVESFFTRLKQYRGTSTGLTVPNQHLYLLCFLLEILFKKFRNTLLNHGQNTYHYFKALYRKYFVQFIPCFQCDIHSENLFLEAMWHYFRIRMNFFLKTENERLRCNANKLRKNRKLLKFQNS